MRWTAGWLMAIVLVGCGGSEDEPAATKTATPAAVKKQQIENYTTEFDAEQTEKLFGEAEDGVDPKTLVGEWQMKLNTTLGLLEVLAPDGGGPMMKVVEDTGDTMRLSERGCPDGFELEVTRSAQEISFERAGGKCPETIDLLVEQPWRRVP